MKFIKNDRVQGYIYGFIGVFCFSLTLPATRLAVEDFSPMIVGLGRSVIAAILAILLLVITKQPIPTKSQWRSLILVAVGVVVGFPIFTTIAMQHVDSSHGSILLGLLPLATACFAVIFGKERPSMNFWIFASLGSLLVVGYAMRESKGIIQTYDLYLVAGVLSAGMGYAVGAKLAKEIGSWQVICWALAIALPFLGPLILIELDKSEINPSIRSSVGIIYLSVVSMFLAFFAWYKGLALGGTAKVGLIQLLQPFFTLLAAALILNETFPVSAVITASVVAPIIFLAQRAKTSAALQK